MTQLSPQQNEALDTITSWYEQDPARPFRLFGPAGTGKTTLAREVGRRLCNVDPGHVLGLSDVLFGAYTGKAAHVLRGKGCTPASTLHSLLYTPRKTSDGKLEFVLNPESPLAEADLLILDEVSMVNRELAEDIESFRVPVLVLGDPEQLEPVSGEGHYTRGKADFELTEIHRFYADGPVGRVATAVRASEDSTFGLEPADMVRHSVDLAMEHDQILCWRNATRWMAIEKIRERLGRPAGVPVAGDRIMCLTNNRGLGVFNGQQFTVISTKDLDYAWELDVDDDGIQRRILAYKIGFTQAGQKSVTSMLGGRGRIMYATFSQAITVHKAQGSQWDSVYVVNEARALGKMTAGREGREAGLKAARRWLYTAATRAADRVTITAPRG